MGVVKKLQVYVSDVDLAIINRLQAASGAVSKAAVIKEALGVYDWAYEQIVTGYGVGAFKEGAPIKEVVIFREAMAKRDAAKL